MDMNVTYLVSTHRSLLFFRQVVDGVPFPIEEMKFFLSASHADGMAHEVVVQRSRSAAKSEKDPLV